MKEASHFVAKKIAMTAATIISILIDVLVVGVKVRPKFGEKFGTLSKCPSSVGTTSRVIPTTKHQAVGS